MTDIDPRFAFLQRASALLAAVVNDEVSLDEAYDHLCQSIDFCICTQRMMDSFDREGRNNGRSVNEGD